MTPPPANESAMEPEMGSQRSGAVTALYASACMEVALSLDLACVDLHTAFIEQVV